MLTTTSPISPSKKQLVRFGKKNSTVEKVSIRVNGTWLVDLVKYHEKRIASVDELCFFCESISERVCVKKTRPSHFEWNLKRGRTVRIVTTCRFRSKWLYIHVKNDMVSFPSQSPWPTFFLGSEVLMEGNKKKGYAWAVSAGLNAALAAVSAKLINPQVLYSNPVYEFKILLHFFVCTDSLLDLIWFVIEVNDCRWSDCSVWFGDFIQRDNVGVLCEQP